MISRAPQLALLVLSLCAITALLDDEFPELGSGGCTCAGDECDCCTDRSTDKF